MTKLCTLGGWADLSWEIMDSFNITFDCMLYLISQDPMVWITFKTPKTAQKLQVSRHWFAPFSLNQTSNDSFHTGPITLHRTHKSSIVCLKVSGNNTSVNDFPLSEVTFCKWTEILNAFCAQPCTHTPLWQTHSPPEELAAWVLVQNTYILYIVIDFKKRKVRDETEKDSECREIHDSKVRQ